MKYSVCGSGISNSARVILFALILPGIASFAFAQVTISETGEAFLDAALERTKHDVTYDGAYRSIGYPYGDVPDSIGVCTDLIIRSYRAIGIDLQKEVHEDMLSAFDEYPSVWGLGRPDKNIDHRRVLNLETYFRRHGKEYAPGSGPDDFHPGDLVTWMLPGNLPHIGIVALKRSADGERPLIVHNIGRGPEVEDVLFEYPITGHFRFGLDD